MKIIFKLFFLYLLKQNKVLKQIRKTILDMKISTIFKKDINNKL